MVPPPPPIKCLLSYSLNSFVYFRSQGRQVAHKRISLPENYFPGGSGCPNSSGAAAKVLQQHLHQQRLLAKRQQGVQKPRGGHHLYGERRGSFSKPYGLVVGGNCQVGSGCGSEFIFQPIAEDEPPSTTSAYSAEATASNRSVDIIDEDLPQSHHERALSAHSYHGSFYNKQLQSVILPAASSSNSYFSDSCYNGGSEPIVALSDTTAIEGLPRVMAASCKLSDSPARGQSPIRN